MLHLRNINPMVRAVGTMGAVSALVGGITFAQLTSNTVALSPNTLSTGTANLEIGTLRNRNNSNGNTGNNNTGDNDNTDNNTSSNTSSDTTTTGTTSNNVNNGVGTLNTSNTTTTNNETSTCRNTTNGTIPGFNLTGSNGLLPGVTSSPLLFCLKNTSGVPLNLTAAIPGTPFSGVTTGGLQPTDVTLKITCDNGGSTTGTLDQYETGTTTTAEMLGSVAANGTTNCQATVSLVSGTTISGTESLPSFDIEFTGTTSS